MKGAFQNARKNLRLIASSSCLTSWRSAAATAKPATSAAALLGPLGELTLKPFGQEQL